METTRLPSHKGSRLMELHQSGRTCMLALFPVFPDCSSSFISPVTSGWDQAGLSTKISLIDGLWPVFSYIYHILSPRRDGRGISSAKYVSFSSCGPGLVLGNNTFEYDYLCFTCSISHIDCEVPCATLSFMLPVGEKGIWTVL